MTLIKLIIQKTTEAITFLNYKAHEANVVIQWQPPADVWEYTGDPICYCQVIAILTSNAIDAYADISTSITDRKVIVTMERSKTDIIIRISDWGKGIKKIERRHLFKSYHSTKKTGLGLGLYIARQSVEMQFSGTMAIDLEQEHTEFIVTLPRGKKQ
jgi:two-component system sensor kinase FixL